MCNVQASAQGYDELGIYHVVARLYKHLQPSTGTWFSCTPHGGSGVWIGRSLFRNAQSGRSKGGGCQHVLRGCNCLISNESCVISQRCSKNLRCLWQASLGPWADRDQRTGALKI